MKVRTKAVARRVFVSDEYGNLTQVSRTGAIIDVNSILFGRFMDALT